MAKKKSNKKADTKTFKVGDRVTWSSQAAGSWKTKTGTIVEVGTIGQYMKTKSRLATIRHHHVVRVTTIHSRGTREDIYFPSTSAMSLVAASPA